MSGTLVGGKAAATTNKAKYGADFYARIGAIGGKRGNTGGFHANRELASRCGKLGGAISRRGEYKLSPEERQEIRLKYELEYSKAYKELLAIHTAANKKRLDEGAITVYTRKRGLVHS
jgi:uncharacterized protein